LALSMALVQPACLLPHKTQTAAAANVPPPQPKPASAAAPAQPPLAGLSVPQTQVQLPPPQPLPETVALPAAKPQPPAAAAAPVAVTAAPKTHTGSGSPAPTRQESPSTAAASPAPPAAAAEPELHPVQEVIPADERKRYQDSAATRKGEIRNLLAQVKSHHVTPEKNRQIKLIESLVQQSDEVEKAGDVRQADALAERGLLLARDLANAR
jgi:hypothetical protein